MSEDLKKSRPRRDAASVGHIDRLPPHSIEAEQGILGCCLISPMDCVPDVLAKIADRDVFYELRHQTIWECLIEFRDGLDVVTVMQRLKDKQLLEQVGGYAYLSQLQDAVPSAANLSYYLDIVFEKYLLRKTIQVCSETIGRIYDFQGEASEILDSVEKDVLAIRPKHAASDDIKTLVLKATDRIEQKCTSGDKLTGLSTGLADLDKLTDGLHQSEMIVVAALPSRGKTGLAVNIGVHNALKGNPVAIFSAEMHPVQLVVRSICSESQVNAKSVYERDIPKMTVAASRLYKAPLYIEQASGFTVGQLCAIARRLNQKHGLKLIVIDYLQRLHGVGDTHEQKIASISAGVKDLAMELAIPIILLSQVNKDGMTKHAAATTEDCDSLWKLENDGDWENQIQPVNLNVEKCRDGETGQVKLVFFKTFTRFECATKIANQDVPEEGN